MRFISLPWAWPAVRLAFEFTADAVDSLMGAVADSKNSMPVDLMVHVSGIGTAVRILVSAADQCMLVRKRP